MIAEGLLRSRVHRPPHLGFDELAARVRTHRQVNGAAHRPRRRGIHSALAIEYGRSARSSDPAQLRSQICAGGMINVACLPALTGAWRVSRLRCAAVDLRQFSVDAQALARPDLYPDAKRFRRARAQHVLHRRRVLDSPRPRRCARSTSITPTRSVAPDSHRVRAGFAREDLFCVVH